MGNCHFDFPGKLTDAAQRSPSNGAMGVGLKEISQPQPVEAQRRRGGEEIFAHLVTAVKISAAHIKHEKGKKKKKKARQAPR